MVATITQSADGNLAQDWVCQSSYVAMRDATLLATYVFRPLESGALVARPLPVVWAHDRYHQVHQRPAGAEFLEKARLLGLEVDVSVIDSGSTADISLDNFPYAAHLLNAGYVVIVVDVRGTGASCGINNGPFAPVEACDAYDITEWIAAQDWCDGNVGMFGRSYLGISQYLAASAAPPHLKAIFPQMALFDLYAFGWDGGIFRDDFARSWGDGVRDDDMTAAAVPLDDDPNGELLARAHRDHARNSDTVAMFEQLPLRDSQLSEGEQPYFARSPHERLAALNDAAIPVCHLGGWYDIWTRDALLWHKNLSVSHKLIIGPWSHATGQAGGSGLNLSHQHKRWFDYWLKGIDTGVTDDPAISYYTLGAPKGDEWRTTDHWPLQDEVPADFYFHVGSGLLSERAPDQGDAFDSYEVDYTTTSGPGSRWVSGYGGPFHYGDMAENDEKALCYTSEPLVEGTEITGHPVVHLYARTAAPDFDLFVYLEEVDSAGKSTYVTEGCLRASHRITAQDSLERLGLPYHRGLSTDIEPVGSSPIELAFDLHPISYVFSPGSRIRVAITGADCDNAATPELSPPPRIDILSGAHHLSRIRLPLIPAPESKLSELSSAQKRFWFLEELGTAGSSLHMPAAVAFDGPLDVAILERCLTEIMHRHEALRTSIVVADGSPKALVRNAPDVSIVTLEAGAADEGIETWLESEPVRKFVGCKFDLQRDLPVRVGLARLDDDCHVLVVVCHHTAADAAATAMFFDELSMLYKAFSIGEQSPLRPVPVQYQTLVQRQLAQRQSEKYRADMEFWQGELADAPRTIDLPHDRPRPTRALHAGKTHRFQIDAHLGTALHGWARASRISLHNLMLGAFAVLLGDYSGENDLVVACPNLQRDDADAEHTIGCFINLLPIRARLDRTGSVQDNVNGVHRRVLRALEHRSVPFEDIVDMISPERNLSISPLAQVSFSLVDVTSAELDFGPVGATWLPLESQGAKFDLSLLIEQSGGELSGALEYSTELFDDAIIELLVTRYLDLLKGMVRFKDRPLRSLMTASRHESLQLLKVWNRPVDNSEVRRCIHTLVEDQALSRGNDPAVTSGATTLTFGQLNERANVVATHLIAGGVLPEHVVGVQMERSIDCVIAMLAILKAGGAWLPLSPNAPAARRSAMLANAQSSLVLVPSRSDAVEAALGVTSMCLDEVLGNGQDPKANNPSVAVSPDNLAYVIFTSGSTGEPKGVQITHTSAHSFIEAMRLEPGVGPSDRVYSLTAPTFDISILETLGALACGAHVTLAPSDWMADPASAIGEMEASGANVIQSVPTMWRILLDAGWRNGTGKRVLVGGESLAGDLCDDLLATGAQVWNMYGPTETTIWSTTSRLEPGSSVTIGCPIRNTRCYVLDGDLQPVSIGACGELFIGGDGVARGYAGAPGHTAQRFLPDPFDGRPGVRMYRTGDVVRYRGDGTLEFIGRIDRQEKIRGVRVEPLEIEVALRRHPQVANAVVITFTEDAGARRLVAYVVPEDDVALESSTLRSWLSEYLPLSMVPSVFMFIDAIPTLTNGKVNYHDLPAVEAAVEHATIPRQEPLDEVESAVGRIWVELLSIESVGSDDDFFELGGDSLTLIGLRSAMSKTFNVSPSLPDLFAAMTIKDQADLIKKLSAGRPEFGAGSPVHDRQGVYVSEGLTLLSDIETTSRVADSPIFVLPAHGSLTPYWPAAVQLGQHRQVFGVKPPSADTRHIEDFVPEAVKAICSQPIDGPYELLGWSSAGILALDVAHVMISHGYEVAVTLLDTHLDPGVIDDVAPDLDVLDRLGSQSQIDRYQHWLNMMAGHRPKPFASPVSVRLVSASAAGHPEQKNRQYSALVELGLNVDVFHVESDHYDLMEQVAEWTPWVNAKVAGLEN